MPDKDKTLICVQCNKEFTFTVGEQEFYREKGLQSEPKRCKECRVAKRKQKNKRSDGIYRSPAFENSAPAHQKIRGRRGHRGRFAEYRSPGLNDRSLKKDEYRSPAFRESEAIKPEEEYRSPGFREYDHINPSEEYRAPGFREHADIELKEEYRAPGFQDAKKKYKDEKPLFSSVCAECGQDTMVPFLPEEGREVFCQECYKAQREAAKNRGEDDSLACENGASPVEEAAILPEEAATAPEEADPPDETPAEALD